MPTDKEIEKEIKNKGLNAPRITPDHIEKLIVEEVYINAAEAYVMGRDDKDIKPEIFRALQSLTICVLVLENGFTVLGKSAPASPDNFNKELGEKIAKQNAVNEIWPLEGYLLKQQLHDAK